MEPTVVIVAVAALVTALATGLGALPFALVRRPARSWIGASNAVAAGFMLAASVALVLEGRSYGLVQVAAGALIGAVGIAVARRLLAGRDDHAVGSLRGADARRAITIVAVMTAHSFAEGVAVGVSFGGGESLGIFIALAIAVHNIPEGLAISLVLVPRGASVRQAAAWSVVSSLPQPLMAVPAFLFVEWFDPLLPYGLGFAAGAMTWLLAAELIPDARAELRGRVAVAWLAAAFAVMTLVQAVLPR